MEGDWRTPRCRGRNLNPGEILRRYGLTERMKQQGMEPVGSTPDQSRTEIDKWAKVVKVSGAKVD